MSLQEIFNTSVSGVIRQGAPSIKEDGGGEYCAYRDGNGNACAAGQLIPNSEYSPNMEEYKVYELEYFLDKYETKSLELISQLQSAHDSLVLSKTGSSEWDNLIIWILAL